MKLPNGKLGAVTGGLALAVAFIGGWEGLRLTAYPDRLAGGIPTVCYGETRGVSLGDSHTKAECDAMLEVAVVQFESGLDRCMTPPTVLPLETKVAFVSWAYNVGTGNACGSTLVRMVNRGDYAGACNQLPRWNRANGRVIQGLTNRRNAERDLCLFGLQEQHGTISDEPEPAPASASMSPEAILNRKC